MICPAQLFHQSTYTPAHHPHGAPLSTPIKARTLSRKTIIQSSSNANVVIGIFLKGLHSDDLGLLEDHGNHVSIRRCVELSVYLRACLSPFNGIIFPSHSLSHKTPSSSPASSHSFIKLCLIHSFNTLQAGLDHFHLLRQPPVFSSQPPSPKPSKCSTVSSSELPPPWPSVSLPCLASPPSPRAPPSRSAALP